MLNITRQENALLDLLNVSREDLMRDVTVGGSGHCNHEMVEIKIFGEKRKIISRVVTLDFKSAKFKI